MVEVEVAPPPQQPLAPAPPQPAARGWRGWPGVFELLAPRLKSEHGLPEGVLDGTRDDKVEGAPLFVVDCENEFEIVYASSALEIVTGWSAEEIVGTLGLQFLCMQPDATHELLNGQAWDRLLTLHARARQRQQAAVAAATALEPFSVLLVSALSTGAPFWNVMDSVPIASSPSSPCRYIVHVLVPLDAAVPRCVYDGGGDTALATAYMDLARVELAKELAALQEDRAVGPLLQAAERVRRVLVHTHEDAQEGDHYVPRLGWDSVEAFDKLNALSDIASKVEEQMRAAWQVSKNDCARFMSGRDGAGDLACCLADPNGVDCPLVFASAGFEELTGYRRCWALGRNCRFVQPSSRRTNAAVNRLEFRRIREFCKLKKEGFLLSLLLNERADGRHFWNLLYMEHVYPYGSDAGVPQTGGYIFAVLTPAAMQKEALDMLVLQELGGPGSGERCLQTLRDMLRKREETFRPSKHSLLELAMDVSMEWMRGAGRQVSSFWDGVHFVPRIGVSAALEFSGRWPAFVDACSETLQKQLSLQDAGLSSLRSNKEASALCVVCDPMAMDCPLVFMSRGFEEATGYEAAYALGRNCRFMQPNTEGINEAVNEEELAGIRDFCRLRGEQAAASRPLAALMLNQRRTGERFWTLLHLTHVSLSGRPYILGTYVLLTGVRMPALIKDAAASEAVMHTDMVRMTAFCQQLAGFLTVLRKRLQGRDHDGEAVLVGASGAAVPPLPADPTPADLAAFAREALQGFGANCLEAVESEQEACLPPDAAQGDAPDDSCWAAILQEIQGQTALYEHFVREAAEAEVQQAAGGRRQGSALSLADPRAKDCPLVYVSPEFESLTGYSRDMVLGRNCRLLQPQDTTANDLLNKVELDRVSAFCAEEVGAQGERIVTLLVNVDRDAYPFWNLLVLERVVASGRPFILAVQTRICFEERRLTELLALDGESLVELDRLRHVLRKQDSRVQERGPRTVAEEAIAAWASTLPPCFELPTFTAAHAASQRPCVSLELGASGADLSAVFHDALEEGVRHFHVVFQQEQRSCRDERAPLVTRLAESLLAGGRRHFHMLHAGIGFTVVTPPGQLHAFAEVHKLLRQHRYAVSCWMLDCRGAAAEQVQEAWQVMSRAARDGEVPCLGLWGVTRQAADAAAAVPDGVRMAVAAVEVSVGKDDVDPAKAQLLEQLRSEGVALEAYGLFGAKQCLVHSESLVQEASHLVADPALLLMRWAESKDLIAVVPRLRAADGEPPLSRDDERDTPTAECQQEEDDGSEAIPIHVHRRFVRQYRQAPSAQICVAAVEKAAGLCGSRGELCRRVCEEQSQRRYAENWTALDKVRSLDGLTARQKALVSDFAVFSEVFEAGARIVSEGEVPTAIYVVRSGELSVMVGGSPDPSGKLHGGTRTGRLGPGDAFGEQAVQVLRSSRSPVTVVADTKCELACVGVAQLKEVLEEDVAGCLEREFLLSALRRLPAISHASPAQLRRVADAMDVCSFQAGEPVGAGLLEPGLRLLLVVDGELSALPGAEDERVTLSRGMWCADSERSLSELPAPEARFPDSAQGHIGLSGLKDPKAGEDGARVAFLREDVALEALRGMWLPDHGGGSEDSVNQYLRKVLMARGVPIFGRLSGEQVDGLVEKLVPVTHIAGTSLVRQGDAGDALFMVAEGELQVHVDGALVRTLVRGCCFGERSLLFDEPHNATVTVSSPSADLLSLGRHAFEQVVNARKREELIQRLQLPDAPPTLRSLRHLRALDAGTFGVARLVAHRQTGARYMLRRVRKVGGELPPEAQQDRALLAELEHPFVARMLRAFETQKSLYVLMEDLPGGPLARRSGVSRLDVLSRKQAQFVVASLVLALECLHERHIVLRGLQPESIRLDAQGYVKLLDLGTAKKLSEASHRTWTMVGSPPYMAPELIRGRGYGTEVDVWALGVVFYELVCGQLPFGDGCEDEHGILTAILDDELQFPARYGDAAGRKLIEGLLTKLPKQRLGVCTGGWEDVKDAKLFRVGAPDNFFSKLVGRELESPFSVRHGEVAMDGHIAEEADLLSDADELELRPADVPEDRPEDQRGTLSAGTVESEQPPVVTIKPPSHPRNGRPCPRPMAVVPQAAAALPEAEAAPPEGPAAEPLPPEQAEATPTEASTRPCSAQDPFFGRRPSRLRTEVASARGAAQEVPSTAQFVAEGRFHQGAPVVHIAVSDLLAHPFPKAAS